jgi:signal transduction histidine kinase/ligand-binding sensor domain-containing protein
MTQFNRSRNFLFVSVFLLIFSNLVPKISLAQSVLEQIGRLPVTTYTPEEYEGAPQVWTAIQSKEGLMYFGTSRGLHEYDGVSWRSIFGRNSIEGARSLAKDAQGRIFYGGRNFGYLMSNPKGEMHAVSLLHLIPEEIRSGIDIFSINFLGKYLFLQTRVDLIRIELAEDFSLKSLKTWPAETTFSYAFVQESDIFIYQNERGLFRLMGEEIKLVPGTEILGKDRFRIMLPYPSEGGKTFLLGGFSTGFYLFDGISVSKFPTQVDQLIKEGAGLLYHALPYQGNYILSFAGSGIVMMSPKGEILNRIGTGQGLPSDVVYGVYLDQNQGLWSITEDGIARITINSPIQTFGKELGITSRVLSIQKQRGRFFLGTTNGLVRFDTISNTFQSVQGISSNQIFDLTIDGEDLIVPSNELIVYRNGKSIRLNFPKDGSSPMTLIIPKNRPNLLLVGTTKGLLLYERGLSKEFPWELKGKVPGIDEIQSVFFEGKDGTIFTGGSGKFYALGIKIGGLESVGTESLKSKVFEFSNSDSFSLIDGEFYVKNSEGMQKFSETEQNFFPTEDFKAVESELLDFSQDKSGITWYETKEGKKYILKRNKEGKFVKDESPNSISPYLSYYDFLDEDSIMWFGNQKGLVRYDPKKDNQDDKEFFTLIRRIETKTDTIPLPQYGGNKRIAPFERKDNSYRFEFAAPYFEDEKKTKYQTYLEGFDPDWVDWNDNKFKEYTNLPAGTYTFRVRAQAFTGRVSEEASYSFVVLAPWYATWWAYLIYVLLIGAVITGIVKWRSQKLKAENRLLEEKVHERTLQLEKSITDLKSTQAQLIQSEKMASLGELTAGIAHEIQNPLNFVNNFAELSVELIDEMNEEIENGDLEEVKEIATDLRENLNKINHHGKRAGSIVRGMLAHSRKSSTDKEETDLNALADECLRLSFHGLRAKDKSFSADFKTDFDPTIPKINVVSQDIGRVILNLINNAFYAVREKAKSAPSDFKPEVIVQTRHEDNHITVMVHDNGQGIPESIQEKILQPFFTTKPAGEGTGLGLSLSYDIIKAHGGELKLESEVGKGTTFSMVLPMDS